MFNRLINLKHITNLRILSPITKFYFSSDHHSTRTNLSPRALCMRPLQSGKKNYSEKN